MSSGDYLAIASVIVSMLSLGLSTLLLTRQNKQLEHERNALAILDAIGQLTDPAIIDAFAQLEGIGERYKTVDDVASRFDGSADDRALLLVAQYVETVACLARRRVLDASLLVDAVGFMLRSRWSTVLPFVRLLRRLRENEYIFENFEWLAMYSVWWKETPRPERDPNYDERQFAGVTFKV
jgi:hypothetical protein